MYLFEDNVQVRVQLTGEVAYIASGSRRVSSRRTDHRRAVCTRSGQLLLRRL